MTRDSLSNKQKQFLSPEQQKKLSVMAVSLSFQRSKNRSFLLPIGTFMFSESESSSRSGNILKTANQSQLNK